MREYDYWLASCLHLTPEKKRNLVGFFENARNIYLASEKELVLSGIVNMEEAENIKIHRNEFDLNGFCRLEKEKIGFTCIGESDYPKTLSEIYDAPYGLFYKGRLPESFENAVAIVGARRCSAYGRVAATDIGKEISNSGGLIVSGMARGVDTASHIGALMEKKPTVAVLGCGVDICYPAENKNVYESIAESGCIISELVPGTGPLPLFFPLRNRIISGLSRTVIVVEAALRSGSLITADQALEQGRDVYALPGRINDGLSAGSNRLIEQGAGIISSIDGLIETLTEEGILPDTDRKKTKKGLKLSEDENRVFLELDYMPVGVDELLIKTKLNLPCLIKTVNELIKKGAVKEEGKNRYVRNRI